MRRVKCWTARRLFDGFPRLRKRFWGRHVWGRGYFCVTSRAMTKEKTEECLAHHLEPKDGADNFEIE